jgi:hypothetical protein
MCSRKDHADYNDLSLAIDPLSEMTSRVSQEMHQAETHILFSKIRKLDVRFMSPNTQDICFVLLLRCSWNP